MPKRNGPPARSTIVVVSQSSRKSKKAIGPANLSPPIQLTLFDYAVAIGVALFSEQPERSASKPRRRRKAEAA